MPWRRALVEVLLSYMEKELPPQEHTILQEKTIVEGLPRDFLRSTVDRWTLVPSGYLLGAIPGTQKYVHELLIQGS